MLRLLPGLALIHIVSLSALSQGLIDNMDTARFVPIAKMEDKVRVEVVEGESGKALQFGFAEGSKSAFAARRASPLATAEWDNADGISFWVKGDGSPHFGAMEWIWQENYALRYDYAFPINHTGWKKIVVPWRDFIPVLPAPGSKPLDPINGNAPSKLSQLWIGKSWYWKNYPAHSFAIDDIRLESEIPIDTLDFKPADAPLARVLAKLQAGQPVTIVTMGDSLTDYAHWANKPVNWPTLLKEALRERFKSEVTIVNPAIGGTQLTQNLILLPRWIATTPEPDLVTVCFGYNDWEAGMRGERFFEVERDAVDRIRRATGGKADVLLMTSSPSVEKWDTLAELSEAARKAAREKNAGIADIEKAMHTAGAADRERLFARDKGHLGPEGHRVFVTTVLEAIATGGATSK
jgi:lysophospholipase L1-like esterase